VKGIVSSHGIGAERCEELFCPLPVVPDFVTYVFANLYNDC